MSNQYINLYCGGDYYYCESGWLVKDNPLRVFQLQTTTEAETGEIYFYPKYDGVFITDDMVDDNGYAVVSCRMDKMRKASYKEAKDYIWEIYNHKETNLKLYDNNRKLKNLFVDMKGAFDTHVIFERELNELGDFTDKDIYTDSDRVLLNLLRSYYKCRLWKK